LRGAAASLIESELFGREKARSPALWRGSGSFRNSDGSPFFLDEVGELPLELQPKLLASCSRANSSVWEAARHQSRCARDCGTNRPLEQAGSEGRFRQDLFYRLDVISDRGAPLRERRKTYHFCRGRS